MHELRTPLNCIISMIQLTIDTTEEASVKKFLPPTLASAKLLASLVNDLLDLAQ